jgi:hypothetical protein
MRPTPDQIAAGLAQMLQSQTDTPPYLVATNVAPGGEIVFIPDKLTDQDVRVDPSASVQIPRRLEHDHGLKRLVKSGFLSLQESDTLPEELPQEADIPPEYASMDKRDVQAARQLALQPNSDSGQKTMHLFDKVTEATISKDYGPKKNRAEASFLKNCYCDVLTLALHFDNTFHKLSKSQRKHVTERRDTLRVLVAQYLMYL